MNIDDLFKIQKKYMNEKKKSLHLKRDISYYNHLLFLLNNNIYAIDMQYIKKIIEPVDYVKLPNIKNRFIMGVFNLEVDIIPLVDIKYKFGISRTLSNFNMGDYKEQRYIIFDYKDTLIGCLIDKILGIGTMDNSSTNIEKINGLIVNIKNKTIHVIVPKDIFKDNEFYI